MKCVLSKGRITLYIYIGMNLGQRKYSTLRLRYRGRASSTTDAMLHVTGSSSLDGLQSSTIVICQVVRNFKSWSSLKNSKFPSLVWKSQATGWYVFYRHFSGLLLYLMLPSAGIFTFLVVTLVFLIALEFPQRPYYHQQLGLRGNGSPLIAIWSGLIAFACVPALTALAGNSNIITLLTGISHEKFNTIQRLHSIQNTDQNNSSTLASHLSSYSFVFVFYPYLKSGPVSRDISMLYTFVLA